MPGTGRCEHDVGAVRVGAGEAAAPTRESQMSSNEAPFVSWANR